MTDTLRIPNLPIGKMVDTEGNASDDELTFRTALINSLQQNFGNEGLVMPIQNAANILTIQNNQLQNGEYTCAFGTMLYNSDANSIMIAVDGGGGVPLFKTVTLT